MEQAQSWMWMKKRQLLKSHFQASMNSINDSWEEKAFAEDAAGPLGGCIWPPRSYCCSFCKREFRSAQALGGHMNVHRRDRARLKQSPSSHNEVFEHQNRKSPEPYIPSEVCTIDSSVELNSGSGIVASSLSCSRVSLLSTQENLTDHTFVSSSSIIQEQHEGCPYSYNLSGSDSLAVKLLSSTDSKPEVQKNPRQEDSTCLTSHAHFVETDLFIGLNSVVKRNPSIGSCGDEALVSCKKPKTTVSAVSFLVNPRSNERCTLQSQVVGPNSSSMEDIDLELRLGEPSKVK